MYATVWLILMILFLIVEAATVTIVSLWFAVGSLAAAIAALLCGPLWLQVLLFAVVSAAMLAGLRPFVRKNLRPNLTSTNIDAVIGTQGYVLEDIDNLAATGRVKLGGMDWTARSVQNVIIPAGTLVRVARIEGVKVFVEVAETPAAK